MNNYMNHALINLRNTIKAMAQLPDEEIDILISSSRKTVYEKGNYFSTPYNPSTSICFIEKGLFRSCNLDRNGKEHTNAFFEENMFMSSYSAITHNITATVYMQALEESILYEIERICFLNLLNNHVGWRELLQKATEQDCLRMGRREAEFLMFDSKDRYKNFLNGFPQFEGRIQQQYIASYLGISPETLCRIRTNL